MQSVMKLDKKKTIIIASSVIVLLLIIFLIIFLVKKNGNLAGTDINEPKIFAPDFLSVEEKTRLGIPTEMKIQAMMRDEKGTVTIYKIIKSDADIIDPKKVESINPRNLER